MEILRWLSNKKYDVRSAFISAFSRDIAWDFLNPRVKFVYMGTHCSVGKRYKKL